MQIISEPKTHENIRYFKHYEVGDKGYGWAYDCDQDGVIDIDSLNADQAHNYARCLLGVTADGQRIVSRGVRKHVHTWREDAIGLCDCGNEVVLDGFTCTCEKCGADYNQSGQRLAPREQWGEETGEYLADILRIP